MSKASQCDYPPAKGLRRVYISPGPELFPQDFKKWSKSGHGWSVIDIPERLYHDVLDYQEAYVKAQRELRAYMESHPRFCSCGSDHADLEPESDWLDAYL